MEFCAQSQWDTKSSGTKDKPPASKSTSLNMDSGVGQKPLVFLVTNAQEVGLQVLGQGDPSENHL